MKKIFIAMFAAAAVLAGCNKTEIENGGGMGTLRFSLNPSIDDTYKDRGEGMLGGGSSAQKAATKAVDNEAILNSMLVTISNKNGVGEARQWKYSEMPSVIELTEGSYTITAVSSGDNKIAAWDQPIYGGAKEFSIVTGSTSTVELVCSITNVKVSMNCTETFKEEFTDYTITVRSSAATADDGFLNWTKTEVEDAKEGYFSAADLTVTVQAYRWSDNTEQKDPVQAILNITGVQAKDHITVNIDARATGGANLGENSGDSASFITIDDGTNDRDESIYIPGLGEIPVPGDGGDTPDPVLPDAPTLEWEANPDFSTIDIKEGMDVNLIVKAPGKIESFIVEVSENFQSFISILTTGNVPYLDLINDEQVVSTLGELLPVGNALDGQTEVLFSLSNVVTMILTPGIGVPGDDYVFTLRVTDESGQEYSKSLTFHYPKSE